MRLLENPVLQGMQMGNEISKLQLNGFFDAMQRAAQNANNAYLDNRRRMQQLNNIAVGLTASGEQANPNWWNAANEPVRRIIIDQQNKAHATNDASTPSYFAPGFLLKARGASGEELSLPYVPDFISAPKEREVRKKVLDAGGTISR